MCGDVRSDRWRRGGRACPCAQTTDQEGQRLQQIVRRGSTNSVRYRRAMMLLASAGGKRVLVIAQLVAPDEDTVRDVIHRFNGVGLACLDPRWAGGRPRLLSDDDEDFVVQTATTRPTKLGQPFTRWSPRKLVAYLRTVHGRVIRIGREALRGLLARCGVTFQRTKTWKESTDPDREAKLDRIEHVLDRFPTGSSRSTSSAHSGSGRSRASTWCTPIAFEATVPEDRSAFQQNRGTERELPPKPPLRHLAHRMIASLASHDPGGIMRTRTAVASIALLTAALTACGTSETDRQADCQKAINATRTYTVPDRPEACQVLSEEDYEMLRTAWVSKNRGINPGSGVVDTGK